MCTPRLSIGRASTLSLTLAIVTFVSAASAQSGRIQPTGAPIGGTVHVRPGAAPDPTTTTVTGGGPIEHPECGGFVTGRPQLSIVASADVPWMRVYVTSEADTSLAILGPGGQWRCAVDTYGGNPSVDSRFRRGTWRVWVGTTALGVASSAVITATTQRTQRPPDAPITASAAPGGLAGLAQQVLTGLGGAPTSPLAVPLATLTRAGLTPNGIPTALDSVLRQPDAGVGNLSPAQVAQLAELARAGLTSEQLQTVATTLAGARSGQPTLSPTQATQLGELARGGAGAGALQSAVTSMLGAGGAAR